MNKELFVSSTPHETKVGLVEDDLLAEIYLERENEYTLAGSIYKGRVTRVLPGMQSAFVDIGLERDAFLYVSDFMELEEHDEDLTDVVPANRGAGSACAGADGGHVLGAASVRRNRAVEPDETFEAASGGDFEVAEEHAEGQASQASEAAAQPSSGGDSQDRERGGFRGRRRRRGGRRDGRGDGRGEGRGDRDRAASPPSPSLSPRVLRRLCLVPRNHAARRSLDRRPDTSRWCSLENRFRSTGAWRRQRRCRSKVGEKNEPPNLLRNLPRRSPPPSRKTNRFSPRPQPNHCMSSTTMRSPFTKNRPSRLRLPWTGTANFTAGTR
jgi:hypothetical protein